MKGSKLTGASWQSNRRLWAGAGIALVAVIATIVYVSRLDAGPAESALPTFKVQRGPLTISISQAGTIRAAEQEIITSQVEGQTTLIYLIEEGARVNEGDLLAELDASLLQDNLVEQQIRVQNAEAAFIRARENLAVVKNQTESDIAVAELDYTFAQEDLNQYVEGKYKQELMAADSKITLAEQKLQLAADNLEWSEKLFKENYLAQTKRDTDRLAHNQAKLDLELAIADKNLLENFTYKREIATLESDVEQKARALERVKLKSSADIIQAEADLTAKEAELRQQQTKEVKNNDQIAKTRIIAPRDGLVVYATSVNASWRGNNEPLEEGQAIRERQELIYLPTADRMIAVVQVHESNLDLVRLGLPVILTVDALQGRTFVGTVSRIAPLPDATSMWMNPDLKVYRTEIAIEGQQPELRTGMSCMAEIVVDRYDDAVYVPVQAVLRIEGNPAVFVRKGDEFSPVPVEVGLDNNRMIRVLSGLEPGQTVMLTPPLQQASVEENRSPGEGTIDNEKLQSMIRDANGKTPAPGTAAGRPESGDDPSEERPAMTPEQREAMRKRFEAMTPEERQQAMQRLGGSGRPGGSGRRPEGGGREGGGSRGGGGTP